jgi:hypothetical protein
MGTIQFTWILIQLYKREKHRERVKLSEQNKKLCSLWSSFSHVARNKNTKHNNGCKKCIYMDIKSANNWISHKIANQT